jgi:hypothetical protein
MPNKKKREVIVYEGLTKDQLYDIMTELPENLLADLHWAAGVEIMDRAYVASSEVNGELVGLIP